MTPPPITTDAIARVTPVLEPVPLLLVLNAAVDAATTWTKESSTGCCLLMSLCEILLLVSHIIVQRCTLILVPTRANPPRWMKYRRLD
mmetsp:Transcript_12904/g.30617  ORF Transcript_12904/g.30617 Transcript_12904/m.30617 type:complete len:88 (-) Transcript_12904:681-944(-)